MSNLPIISGGQSTAPSSNAPSSNFAAPVANNSNAYNSRSNNSNANSAPPVPSHEVLTLLEGLGKLLQAGILTQQEFDNKKTDLLNRF